MPDKLHVEVAYALPERQFLQKLRVPVGTSVEQAITASGVLLQFPQLDLTACKVGIWNRVVKLDQQLAEGDRIEIYRPLIADPKEVRKQRAERAKKEGRANPVTGGRPLAERRDGEADGSE